MGNLINLHYLDIMGAYSLTEILGDIGELKSLHTLISFMGDQNGGLKIEEFKELSSILVTRSISTMENMERVKDTLWAYMKDKGYLDEVDLTWDYGIITSGIFPNFQPHPNLEKLKILP
ncbi:hypothetical protein PVL29_016152 [Vitis rotundifolia]|uniref:R13L1/DRL21-like LRR repeat region domain-containing protein n=1 Tax=Vitis rotundifolia TaxID=103349 RepID=A0AA39DMM0_VITRO|nr:hypothetical protein PVL29_016152 [Vitis rotundifolia]